MAEDIEQIAFELMKNDVVKDFLLKAIIATHPDREALRTEFERICMAHAEALKDASFSKGRHPETVGNVLGDVQEAANRWLAYLRQI